MTIALPVPRALSTKLAGRSFNVVTRLGYNPWIARVNQKPSDHDVKSTSSYARPTHVYAIATRTYATSAASKAPGRPKAHTSRTSAKHATTRGTGKKSGSKTAAGKRKVGRKPKPKKAKPAAKKKKEKSKTALDRERRSKEKTLRQQALLNEPKNLPQTVWTVIFNEASKGSKTFSNGGNSRAAAEKYRSLSPEEREHYNQVANQNREKNAHAHSQWLSQFTPQQVHEANSARKQLKKIHLAKHPELKATSKYAPLRDDRLVKRPVTAYVRYTKDRHASGDFKGMAIAESAKLISREWKDLSASDKQSYEDAYAADQRRYIEEHKSVYGYDPPQAHVKKMAQGPV